jgi:5'-3' exonuclease
MIHQAAQRVLHKCSSDAAADADAIETEICTETWAYLQKCIKEIKPNNVHICVDGVAPIAKMSQQRKRRYLSLKRWQLCPASQRPVWDTNAITPGTDFMNKLQQFLENKITNLNNYSLSAANEAGEGEHKIFAKIAATAATADGASICIYGLDADLIMLSLLAHRPAIYLMRETDEDGIYTYLNVHELRLGILSQLVDSWGIDKNHCNTPYSTETCEIIESYLVMCFMLGNDFLPHMPSLSLKKDGYTRLITAYANAYKQTNTHLVAKSTVCLDVLVYLFKELQQNETEIVLAINEEYLRREWRGAAGADADSWPMLAENKDITLAEAISTGGAHKWRGIYYKNCFDTKINDTKIVVRASTLYLKGMLWTYAYYKRICKDDTWLYPYAYAPTILDLGNTLSACTNELTTWAKTSASGGSASAEFVHENVQLLCVLPPDSVPKHLAKYIRDPSFGIAHLFPDKYHIKTYLHTKLWECAPRLPPIDVQLVQSVLKSHM